MDGHCSRSYRLLAAVKAAWAVEKKTFTDVIMKKCRDSILKERERWVQTELLTDKFIRDAAVEDPSLQDKREQLKNTITKMRESLRMLAEV